MPVVGVLDDAFTVSLLHFDSGLTDEAGLNWIATGGATVSAAQKKFGSCSLLLDGASQYLSMPALHLLGNNFTIDWWEYKTLAAGISVAVTENNGFSHILASWGGDSLYMSSKLGASNWDIASGKSIGAVVLNTWKHKAIVRNGSTFYLFSDGVQTTTWTSATAFDTQSIPTKIGYSGNGGYFKGYIDEFRVPLGIARWTANFTPPTAAYGAAVAPILGRPQAIGCF